MFLTKECDYAIRVIRGLGSGNITSVKYICESEHIPQQFAYKILKKLEKAGFVVSYRGSAGGYQLISDLNKITLLDVVCSIDDQLVLNKCLIDGYFCPNNEKKDCCKVHHELKRVQADLVANLQSKTMKEILASEVPQNSLVK